MLTPEEIEQNWQRFYALCGKVGEERAPALLKMLDVLGERIATCPASHKRDYHNAFPGGLVEHSLRVLNNAVTLNKAFEWNLPRGSLIIASLGHDLGKIGDLEKDYYVVQNDAWRVEKCGEEYKYNPDLPYVTVTDRGLFLLQHFGVCLTQDEYMAIKLSDGFSLEENKHYVLREPVLAHVVMTADYIATKEEKISNDSEQT